MGVFDQAVKWAGDNRGGGRRRTEVESAAVNAGDGSAGATDVVGARAYGLGREGTVFDAVGGVGVGVVGIETIAAVEGVGQAVDGVEDIVAGVAEELVAVSAADERVVAWSAMKLVFAGLAE